MAFGSQKKGGPVSDINVTPLVDVMLVLLVIFMVTAPLMFNGIQLDLPKTKKVHNLNLNADQVILSVSKAGDYFIGEDKLLEKELVNRIKTDFIKFKNDTLFLRAHYNLRYGKIAKLMSFLKAQGISKIALVTEIEKE